MKQAAMNEEQMVFLVRNALLVAGQEIGKGDSWPVVKDTIYKLMKDWEDLKIERAVDEELKTHLYEQIKEMEEGIKESAPEVRPTLEKRVKELREICDAYFEDFDPGLIEYDEERAPEHVRRMRAIIGTMEDEND